MVIMRNPSLVFFFFDLTW